MKEKLEKSSINNTLNQTFQSNMNTINSRVKQLEKTGWMISQKRVSNVSLTTNNNQNNKISKEDENLLLKNNKRIKDLNFKLIGLMMNY